MRPPSVAEAERRLAKADEDIAAVELALVAPFVFLGVLGG